MKTIPTMFDGIKYRSRTEARWAAFFTAMDIDFVYEPEGYEIGGLRYLVDFWVPSWGAYIEVKNTDVLDEIEIKKAKALSHAANKKVIIANGPPSMHNCYVFEGDSRVFSGKLLPCRRCERMTVAFLAEDYSSGGYTELGLGACERYDCGDRMPVSTSEFEAAVKDSMNQRFGVYE